MEKELKTIMLSSQLSLEVTGLSLNSKTINDGNLFLACNSFAKNMKSSHGIAYAGDAINNGASVIAWEPTNELTEMPESCVQFKEIDGEKYQRSVPLYEVENLHTKVSQIAGQYYDFPSSGLNVIAITGTNGKTSVSHFIAQALDGEKLLSDNVHGIEYGSEGKSILKHKCGVIGTLGNGLLTDIKQGSHTTPDPISVQRLLSEMKEDLASDVVMEVSSHALSQDRVKAVEINTAVFTNLSRDHLDYHGDMETYAKEKRKLFDMPSISSVVINMDDDEGKKILTSLSTSSLSTNRANESKLEQVISYTCEALSDKGNTILEDVNSNSIVQISAQQVIYDNEGINFNLLIQQSSKVESAKIKVPLIGQFNLSNVLATIGVLVSMDFSIDEIESMIKKVSPVTGRMQKINTNINTNEQNNRAQVVVDFAHTPDALEKSLLAMKVHCMGKLWCVFGCGGDRDKGKRAQMGMIVEKNANEVVITSDNPRTEIPMNIIRDIEKGLTKKDYVIKEDRKEAIQFAIENAAVNDIILLAGKGHENYQEINGIKHPYSDIEFSQTFLEKD